MQKLRRKEGVSAAAAGASDSASTPSKRKRGAGAGAGAGGGSAKKTPRGKKGAAASSTTKSAPLVIDSDDEGDIKESPEKKMKMEPAGEEKVKEEYDDG